MASEPGIEFLAATEAAETIIAEGHKIYDLPQSYFDRLSPLEIGLRLQFDHSPLTRSELIEQFENQIRISTTDFTDIEKTALTSLVKVLEPIIVKLNMKKPWRFIKTNFKATDGNAFYTRGTCIIIPQQSLSAAITTSNKYGLLRTLAHEQSHVYSRFHSRNRRLLYGAIGFQKCRSINIGEFLTTRKISNPDLEDLNYVININYEGRDIYAMLYDFSNEDKFSAKKYNFFYYMENALFEVTPVNNDQNLSLEQTNFEVVIEPETGQPIPINPDPIVSFWNKISRNTTYINHPEEIIADNVAMLVMHKLITEYPDWSNMRFADTFDSFDLTLEIQKILTSN